MTRPLPPDVAEKVAPIPDDFKPTFEDHGRYLRWAGRVEVAGHGPVDLELGFHHHPGRRDSQADGPLSLRASAWQAMELARLGRLDLLSHALLHRHKARRQA